MVGSALTLALIGLGAVSALPTKTEPLAKRQGIIGDPNTSFTWGPSAPTPTCITDPTPGVNQPPCIPAIISGPIKPPRKKRFDLPSDWNQHVKDTIDRLEGELVDLQNKKHKTQDDLDRIEDLKAALQYIAGVTSISAPPGVGTIFHPGRMAKRFDLPSDWNQHVKDTIDRLEGELVELQNKKHKTQDDLDRIEDLKAALQYIAGVTSISAPPGVGTIFHPGKRNTDCSQLVSAELAIESLMHKDHLSPSEERAKDKLADYLLKCGITIVKSPDGTSTIIKPSDKRAAPLLDSRSDVAVGAFSTVCPGVEGAELALERLMHKDHLSPGEQTAKDKLAAFLLGCGITIVKSPDGTSTIIKPSDKRAVSAPGFDLAGIEEAYEELTQSFATSPPSFEAWLAAQQLASILQLYGIAIEKSPAGTTTTLVPGKRQTFTIGKDMCKKEDLDAYKRALIALLQAYGAPDKSPQQVQLVEQVIVTTLRYCGQGIGGWTGPIVPDPTIPGGPITPDPTIPGGPLIPDPYIPGGPIKPDPTVPGGPITPDPTVPGGGINPSNKRQATAADAAALLETLQVLESSYGTYGSSSIPVPIFLIMENMVTVLQAIPGVMVPNWPVFAGGAMQPSN